MRIINVWHVGAWNRNVGDWALCYQLHKLLNQQAGENGLHFKFYFVDGQKTYFHPALIDQMNEEADLLLIGGGGLVFMRPMDESVSGWGFNIHLKDMQRIKPPIVTYALGNNKFPFGKNDFNEFTSKHLREFQNKVTYFSVRTEGTKQDLVNDFGLEANRLEVIPDPGINLFDRPIEVPGLAKDGRPIISVNLAGDRPNFRFAEPPEATRNHFINVLKDSLKKSIKELNAQILFLPHLNQVDTDLWDSFSEGLPKENVLALHQALPFLYFAPGESLYPTIPFFTNIFRQASLHMGMRFHNGVLAYGAEQKFIALGGQAKLMEFIEDVKVPCETFWMRDTKTETSEYVFGLIEKTLNSKEYNPILKDSLLGQKQKLRAFNQKLIEMFS
jgi:polysaccharide pyruvyl transferase WcaK-like protein